MCRIKNYQLTLIVITPFEKKLRQGEGQRVSIYKLKERLNGGDNYTTEKSRPKLLKSEKPSAYIMNKCELMKHQIKTPPVAISIPNHLFPLQ
jgi:hypothetical protein